MHDHTDTTTKLGRRALLKDGALFLAAAGMNPSALLAEDRRSKLRVGMVTDLHFADKPARGSRYYRQTPEKLAEAAERFERDEPDFLVELGDFIDAADSVQEELSFLKRIDRDFSAISTDRHYVLGNHCVFTLKKEEFLGQVEQDRSYYSFDRGDFHFVVLDSCFRSDGEPYGRKNFEWTDPNIPEDELEWLRADLQSASKPTVAFAHQRLDVGNHYGVNNAPAVRKVLEESGKVLAVFQGHNHINDLKDIGGIHYCTLMAMVEGAGAENNGYATMDLFEDGSIQVSGFRKQRDYRWQRTG